jgi:hypothetical protein
VISGRDSRGNGAGPFSHEAAQGFFDMTIMGSFERIEDGFAIGWAYAVDGDSPVSIEVTFNGTVVASGSTGGLRPDVAALGGPTAAGFEIPLPASALWGVGELTVLSNGETIGSRTLTKMMRPAELFAGSVEQMSGFAITGWAVNLEAPHLPVAITVMLGARPVDAIVTNLPRPDVQSQFGTRIPVGFSYAIPAFLRAGAPALLRFLVANTEFELGGSPFLLGGRRATDKAALQSFAD